MDFDTYMAGVKTKSGMSPYELVEFLKQNGFTKKGTSATMVKNFLKEKYDIGHGHAMGIWGILKPKIEE